MAKLAEERGVSDELRRQLAIGETSSEIDRATYEQVKTTLGDLQAKIQAQEEELVFYRGIVSPQDRVAGLRIQSLEALPSDGEGRYLVRLLLVQAIVHSRRVSGAVKLQLEGIQDGQMASFDVAELVVPGQPYDMDYEFRNRIGAARGIRAAAHDRRNLAQRGSGRAHQSNLRMAGDFRLKWSIHAR
jgi:hypothetical protein